MEIIFPKNFFAKGIMKESYFRSLVLAQKDFIAKKKVGEQYVLPLSIVIFGSAKDVEVICVNQIEGDLITVVIESVV